MVIKLTLNREKKAGFSLFEACVVMLVVSIFLAVSASVIPRRNKVKSEADGHGRFECYYKANKLYQQMFQGNSSSGAVEVTECRFNPPVQAKYIVINAVGGGAGGSGGNGGEPGGFYSSFHTSARAAFVMTPGKAGGSGADGQSTSVYYEDDRNGDPLVIAEGGKSNRELKDAKTSDIKQCAITAGSSSSGGNVDGVQMAGTEIACGSIPLCEIKDDKIKVSYCFSSSTYKSKLLDLQTDIIDRSQASWLKPPDLNEKDAIITYYDQGLLDEYNIDLEAYMLNYKGSPYENYVLTSLQTMYPSLFTMELTFDLHRSTTVTPSLLMNYLNGMRITQGMVEYSPGQGGAPGGAGNNGAVLITW